MMPMLGLKKMYRRTNAAGQWVDTEFVPGALTETAFFGTWRPAPAQVIQLLPEGDRQRDPRRLYTRTALVLTKQGEDLISDRVSPDGVLWYEVVQNADSMAGSNAGAATAHYRYLCLLVQESE